MLVFELLDGYYQKFYFFFHDIQQKVSADEVFIRKILVNFHCKIFLPGAIIIKNGGAVEDMYFLMKGEVSVVDGKGEDELTRLKSGSFFGDYQILFGLISNFIFQGSVDSETTCMSISKEKFLHICE
jgi:signal-transduction protein with cAMP-binding, CBS, and nucleotidyltransferase domain